MLICHVTADFCKYSALFLRKSEIGTELLEFVTGVAETLSLLRVGLRGSNIAESGKDVLPISAFFYLFNPWGEKVRRQYASRWDTKPCLGKPNERRGFASNFRYEWRLVALYLDQQGRSVLRIPMS